MKKVKTSILAVLLIAGISGAFATKTAHASGRKAMSYNWQLFDRSGNPDGTLTDKTEAQVEGSTGCGVGTVKCAVATGGPTIYYSN